MLLSSLPGSNSQGQEQKDSELPSLTGKRVVIVEDEGITQLQIHRTLTRARMIVVSTVGNGKAGVDQVLRKHPDLVLMDIQMPVMDGLEATRRILAEYRTCIVLLTAFLDYEEQANQSGASGYLIKPISSRLLLPKLQQALQRCYQRQQDETSLSGIPTE